MAPRHEHVLTPCSSPGPLSRSSRLRPEALEGTPTSSTCSRALTTGATRSPQLPLSQHQNYQTQIQKMAQIEVKMTLLRVTFAFNALRALLVQGVARAAVRLKPRHARHGRAR